MAFSLKTLDGFQITPNGDSMDGIFHHLTTNKLDPITNYILRISSSSLHVGNQNSLNDLIYYNTKSYVQTNSIVDSYIEILFLSDFRMYFTNYSLVGAQSFQFTKEWEVQGLVSYNKWEKISYQESGRFCESTNGDCGNNNVVTFPIESPTIVSGIKFISKVGSVENAHYFLTRGIEVFGTILFFNTNFNKHKILTCFHSIYFNKIYPFVSCLIFCF